VDRSTTRMFQNDFLERMSRIHPATPFVAWVPVAATVIVLAARNPEVGPIRTLWLVPAGTLLWSLAEYLLHRFVFHLVVDTEVGRRIHFLLHGVHHDYPRDRDRLVMPLGASVPLGVSFYFIFRAAFGPASLALFGGFVIGYLAYDGLHWAIHRFPLRAPYLHFIRRHHLLHHSHEDRGFGVSSPLWDVVFRTMPELRRMPSHRADRARSPS
jgi:dihydroceramide fatty acyl 2-hydroxylase